MKDLLNFAACNLVIGGRLVYWFPTTDLFQENDLPIHPCLKIIANSEQILSLKMRRRLITMIKIKEYNLEQFTLINNNMNINLKEYCLK
jgi:tRNA (guanine10-N2)-methyltransferase